MKMEVRCCCQPQKLLGWLNVPDDVFDGDLVQFVVTPKRYLLVSPLTAPDAKPIYQSADVITLPVATFCEATVMTIDTTFGDERFESHQGLALKSEDTPIERLRLIPSFIEAESSSLK